MVLAEQSREAEPKPPRQRLPRTPLLPHGSPSSQAHDKPTIPKLVPSFAACLQFNARSVRLTGLSTSRRKWRALRRLPGPMISARMAPA